MKSTKQLIAAATLTVIGLSAFAQKRRLTPGCARRSLEEPPGSAGRTPGRAQGRHDQCVSANYDFVRRSPSVKTREEVRAELAQAPTAASTQR